MDILYAWSGNLPILNLKYTYSAQSVEGFFLLSIFKIYALKHKIYLANDNHWDLIHGYG